jgi:hypothetical protein
MATKITSRVLADDAIVRAMMRTKHPQQNITAYCLPKMVNINSEFWD